MNRTKNREEGESLELIERMRKEPEFGSFDFIEWRVFSKSIWSSSRRYCKKECSWKRLWFRWKRISKLEDFQWMIKGWFSSRRQQATVCPKDLCSCIWSVFFASIGRESIIGSGGKKSIGSDRNWKSSKHVFWKGRRELVIVTKQSSSTLVHSQQYSSILCLFKAIVMEGDWVFLSVEWISVWSSCTSSFLER